MATGSGGARHPGAPYYEHAAVAAAAAEAASAGTTPPSATTKRCTPLGADGRPVGLPDDVQQQQKDYGMALGSVGGAGGGGGKGPGEKRKTADQGGREGAQEDYYPHPHPQYSCTRSPAAMSFYSYSPTTRAPQRFMFDDADAVGVAHADAGRHRYQPYYHRFHGPMPPYGSPAVPPTTTLPPVPVTMGGSVTPGGAAAVALMAAPLGSPLHLQGQPITPAAVSTAAAAAAAAAARVPTTTTSFPSMSSNASAKVSPREIATTNSAKISPSPTATTSHAPIKTPMGLGASAPLLTPAAVTSDHYQGRDMEALQLVEPPTFESILNFPQGALRKKRGPKKGGKKTKTNDMRICIMCGLSCPTSSNKKKRDGNDTAVVPAQNRGVCTKCDVLVWVQISTGCQIKWCKGCKNFRHWAHFGPKGWTTKCTKCREHQNAKYAEKRGTQLDGRVKNNRREKRIDSRVAEQEAARELLSLHSPRTYEALDQLGLDINEDVPPFPPSIGDEALV